MIFDEISEFSKDLKKLSKKFRNLREDLEVLKKVLSAQDHPCPPKTFRIKGLKEEEIVFIKVKRFAVKSMKGKGANTGMRLIYAYHEDLSRIDFIEIYYKGDKELEDRKRIDKYLKTFSN